MECELNNTNGPEPPKGAIVSIPICIVLAVLSGTLLIYYAVTRDILAFLIGVTSTTAGTILSGYWWWKLSELEQEWRHEIDKM